MPDDLRALETYCVVCDGGAWYALPAMAIREIGWREKTVALPGCPPVVAGLCHLHNEFLPVLRLSWLAGNGSEGGERAERMLVMASPGPPWALLVQEVAGLETLDVSLDTQPRQTDGWTTAVLGSATFDDHVVRVLDPTRLYRFAESLLEELGGDPNLESLPMAET